MQHIPNQPIQQDNLTSITRRRLLNFLVLGTFTLLAKDLLYPASAMASGEESKTDISLIEKYHIFVPYTKARMGGKETFILRSGDFCTVSIPSHTEDNKEIILKGKGQQGNDITVVIHTLYDRQIRIADQVYQEIDKNTAFIQDSSKAKCKFVYEEVEDGQYIKDLIALDLLDYIISTSKLDSKIQQCYEIASTNSRLLGIQQAIELALSESNLTGSEQKLLWGTYASVRASEPVPNFKALTELDTIVANSTLPIAIKQTYSLASATSRALTVDVIIIELINNNKKLSSEDQKNYLLTYQQVRDGKPISDEATLKSLDSFIEKSDILETAKFVYSLARKQASDNQEELVQKIDSYSQDAEDLKNQVDSARRQGAAIVPQATRMLTAAGAEAATGVSISTLSGAAATNATLAFLGGGSVASGGLGMLGGLAVATGGAALIGAAGLLSIVLVSQMDREDLTNLGIAVSTGTLAGAATVFAAWSAASALGVAGTLSGAAAISATISALGGLSIMTGGAALIASGTAFLIWSFLESGKKRDQGILRQLETRIYTLTEDPQPGSLGEFLQKNLQEKYYIEESFSAPYIPLDKLSNALSTWLSIQPNEKIVAMVDSSIFNDAKAGIAFTDQRIIWKAILSSTNSMKYDDLKNFFNLELGEMLSDNQHRQDLLQVEDLAKILSDESDKNAWVNLLREISQKYSSV